MVKRTKIDTSNDYAYWIIAFGPHDAYLVEAKTKEDIYNSNYKTTFRVVFDKLRPIYEIKDIGAEATKRAQSKKSQLDLKIIFDKSIPIDMVLDMHEKKGLIYDRKKQGEIIEDIRGWGDDYLKEQFEYHDKIEKTPLDQLIEIEKKQIEQEMKYQPEDVGKNPLDSSLADNMFFEYIITEVKYPTLNSALDRLYHNWKEVWEKIEKPLFRTGFSIDARKLIDL